jgi:hypothetical protein
MSFIDNIKNFFSSNKEEEIVKALPKPSAKPPTPESKQINPVDVANSRMLEDLDLGGDQSYNGGLNYDQLLSMSRVPLVASVIQTRVNQIAEFSVPSRDGINIGFQIRLKDRDKQPSKEEQKTINEMYDFITSCGDDRISFETNFESFLRMLVRDSLIYDQACFEVVRNRGGNLAGFINVDSRTIRRAKISKQEKEQGRRNLDGVHYVQTMSNKTVAEFSAKDLCFGVRRPRSDVRFYGYGFPELEEAIQVITNLLNADIYNSANFTNGISVNGIIAVKSRMNPQLFRAFRREFYAMLSGSANAKKTPLLQLDPENNEDLQSINLGSSNKDMEFQNWQNYLIKLLCALFQMDPMEIGFKFGNEGQSHGLNEGSGLERLVASQEKGLRPLLRQIQTWINKYIIKELDDRFELVFVGLEKSDPQAVLKMNLDKVRAIMTVNEVRALYDLEPIEHGDLILDNVYLQNKNVEEAGDEEEMEEGEEGMEEGEEMEEAGGEEDVEENDEEEDI